MINTEGVQIEAVAAAAVTFGPYHGQQGRQYTHAYTSTPEAGCVSIYGTFTSTSYHMLVAEKARFVFRSTCGI